LEKVGQILIDDDFSPRQSKAPLCQSVIDGHPEKDYDGEGKADEQHG